MKLAPRDVLLHTYKEKIDLWIQKKIPQIGSNGLLRDACSYALVSEGKRIRPAIVCYIADLLGQSVDVSEAALAIEFFHTASLIADDLPCMDDDEERRSRPTLHKKYNVAVALLASYGLIGAGFRCLTDQANILRQGFLAAESDQRCVLAVENATHNTGLNGATGGQFLDLFPSGLTEDAVLEVIRKKTVSLFECSFVFGWLFGGGAIPKLEIVKKAARHYGTAFQIEDDLNDCDQDAQNERSINYATLFGKEAARHKAAEEWTAYHTSMQILCK